MSFGYSPGDFLLLVNFAHKTYEQCRNAPTALDGFRQEIKSLHHVLLTLKDEALWDNVLRGETGERKNTSNTQINEALAKQLNHIWSILVSLEEILEKFEPEVVISRDRQKLQVKLDHKYDKEHVDHCWPILLQRIRIDLERCRKVLCGQQQEAVPSIEPSMTDNESCDPDARISHTYFIWNCCNCGHSQCTSCRLIRRHRIIAAIGGFLSVLLMSGSFLWLDKVAALEKPSNVVKSIMSMAISVIPTQVAVASQSFLRSSILAAHLLSCTVYSMATIAWFVGRQQISSLNYWYLFGLITTIFWALLGVTPAELFLVFLPLSVSIGICFQTARSESAVNQSPVRCAPKGSGKLGLIFLRPILRQNCRKPTVEQYHDDLERDLKGCY